MLLITFERWRASARSGKRKFLAERVDRPNFLSARQIKTLIPAARVSFGEGTKRPTVRAAGKYTIILVSIPARPTSVVGFCERLGAIPGYRDQMPTSTHNLPNWLPKKPVVGACQCYISRVE